MNPLEHALANLKQQVIRALLESPQQGPGASLDVERVTLTLELETRQTPGPAGTSMTSFFVCGSPWLTPDPHSNGSLLQAPGSPGKHTLTIEFKPLRLASNEPSRTGKTQPRGSETPGSPGMVSSIADNPALLAALSAVIGSPGFDSSARATLLQEVIQRLPADRIGEWISALKEPPGTLISEDIRQASHLLRGILLSGPGKSVTKGVEVIEQIFVCHPVPSILSCLKDAWKTQDDWM